MNDQERVLFMAGRCNTIDELAHLLEHFLCEIIDISAEGQIIYGRKRVEKLDSLIIEIHSDEHAPPHFHVTSPDVNATFRISDGVFLAGHIGQREMKIIRLWHQGAKDKLIATWNDTRPSDCPVGPI